MTDASTRRVCTHPDVFAAPSARPRMLYLRWPLTSYPQYNQRLFERLFIRGFSEHFDVVIAEGDLDYDALCTLHQPDVVMFESGNNNYPGPYTTVRNTRTHPHIPKLGFMRADPMCPSRTTFLAEMDAWGIDTYFTYVSNAGDYLPEIADRLFYWPFFVDPDIYRDYGQHKLLPILLLGNTDIIQYEWRKAIRAEVSKYFQTVVVPHVGYSASHDSQALYDESFSRLINSAFITPTCGGMTKALVNKHLEIPASGSLLLTQETPVMRAFGFRHMETCMFAEAADVNDVVAWLFRHPDEMARITRAGHDLVHTRHTAAQRTQILQWLQLERRRQPGERIVQHTLDGPLSLVPMDAPDRQVHLDHQGTDRALLREAWALVDARQLDEAFARFARCAEYTPYMAEPHLGVAVCHLLTGHAGDAARVILRPIETVLGHGGVDPDPIEWACLVIALLCAGRLQEAADHAAKFSHMHREELDRARWLAFAFTGRTEDVATCMPYLHDAGANRRASIHARAPRTLGAQFGEWAEMLEANGLPQLAGAARNAVDVLTIPAALC